ncbi:MAG TPA: hypothetical protein VLD58_05960, partial [Gemmatimonadales bacterium]|nr:hypothetical protein [Gemmatimonadales bacterium]
TQQLQMRPRGDAPSATGGAVPATRIDPAIERQRAQEAAAKKAAAPVAVAREVKKFPVVPVAIVLVALAIGGGGLAFKDKLLGKAKPDTTIADTSKPAAGGQQGTPDTPGAVVPQDTAGKGKPDTTLQQLSHQTANTATNSGGKPAGGGTKPPPRDSAHGPIGTAEDRLLPTTDEAQNEDPKIRAAARQRAIRVYYRPNMSDSLRASAALVVMGSYTEDQNYRSALAWADSSYRLRPDPAVLTQINVLKQLLGN